MGAYEFGTPNTNPPAFVDLTWVTNQVAKGSNAKVSVTMVTNSNPAFFQWYFNGATPLPGQTASSLTLTNLKFSDAGIYSVAVSNRNGSVTGTVMMLRVTYQIEPPIWLPVNSTVSLGLVTESGRVYWLEGRDDFESDTWHFITGLTNCAGWQIFTDTNASGSKRFYRIGTCPWP